jgi:hypothetical protein
MSVSWPLTQACSAVSAIAAAVRQLRRRRAEGVHIRSSLPACVAGPERKPARPRRRPPTFALAVVPALPIAQQSARARACAAASCAAAERHRAQLASAVQRLPEPMSLPTCCALLRGAAAASPPLRPLRACAAARASRALSRRQAPVAAAGCGAASSALQHVGVARRPAAGRAAGRCFSAAAAPPSTDASEPPAAGGDGAPARKCAPHCTHTPNTPHPQPAR